MTWGKKAHPSLKLRMAKQLSPEGLFLYMADIESASNNKSLYKTLSAPVSAQIEITDACNLACRHCYNYWRSDGKKSSTLGDDRLLFVLKELRNNGVFKATFTGGEPLLFKEMVIRAIEYLRENGIDSAINSNLVNLDYDDALRLRDAGVGSVLASLMSYDEETHERIVQKKGSFQRTVAGIKNVLEAGIPLTVHMVISRDNEDQVYETGRFAAGLGVKSFAATKVSPALGSLIFPEISLSKESVRLSLDSLLSLRRDFGLRTEIMECYPLCLIGDVRKYGSLARKKCTAGVTTMVVGAEGNIRLCIHSDEVAGNIFVDGLKDSWSRMNKWRDGSLIPENCKRCGSLQGCTGGCRVEAQYFGNIAGMDPYASKPSDVLVPARRKTLEAVEIEGFDSRSFRLNPRLKTRREDFGGIVHVMGGGYVFLNKDSYNFIQNIGDNQFSIEGMSEEARRFFSHLFRKKVILPYEK